MDGDLGDKVSIRELKGKVTFILREVREGKAFYVTRRGKPVALLVPLDRVKLPVVTASTKTLRGLLSGAPDLPFEEFLQVKRMWTTWTSKEDA